jgi:hypothetical protein
MLRLSKPTQTTIQLLTTSKASHIPAAKLQICQGKKNKSVFQTPAGNPAFLAENIGLSSRLLLAILSRDEELNSKATIRRS